MEPVPRGAGCRTDQIERCERPCVVLEPERLPRHPVGEHRIAADEEHRGVQERLDLRPSCLRVERRERLDEGLREVRPATPRVLFRAGVDDRRRAHRADEPHAALHEQLHLHAVGAAHGADLLLPWRILDHKRLYDVQGVRLPRATATAYARSTQARVDRPAQEGDRGLLCTSSRVSSVGDHSTSVDATREGRVGL